MWMGEELQEVCEMWKVLRVGGEGCMNVGLALRERLDNRNGYKGLSGGCKWMWGWEEDLGERGSEKMVGGGNEDR